MPNISIQITAQSLQQTAFTLPDAALFLYRNYSPELATFINVLQSYWSNSDNMELQRVLERLEKTDGSAAYTTTSIHAQLPYLPVGKGQRVFAVIS